MTGRVQFRESEETLAYVRGRGLNPNDLARDLFQAEVRRMRAEDRLARLAPLRVALPGDAEAMVREDRDGRAR